METVDFEPEEKVEESHEEELMMPDYGGKIFDDEKAELNFLQRLQTNGELEGLAWDPSFAERSRYLEEKSKGGPTPEQEARFYELSKMQMTGGPEWTPELQAEIAKLYPIMDKKSRKAV